MLRPPTSSTRTDTLFPSPTLFRSIPVFLYQLLFVLALYIASRFGKAALNITTILCLLWTATHLFLVPLAVLQTVVILGSHAVFRRRFRSARSEQIGRAHV